MAYYFAYGSNMDEKQMLKRCPNAKYYGKGFLKDYKLAFTRFSKKWNSAVADILVSESDIVWGIIYSITEEDLKILDRYEGHPSVYKRKEEIVMLYKKPNLEANDDSDNTNDVILNNLNNYIPCKVEVYEVVKKELGHVPKLKYLRKLLDGAFENFLPKEYQEMLYNLGISDYHEKLQESMDSLLDLQKILETGNYPSKVKKEKEWGGANLVITGSKARKRQLNRDYPHDLVVLTPHWQELSWLVNTLYWDEKIAWQVDYTNKHFVLNQFGTAALEYQKENPNDNNPKGICLAVLYSAYKVFTSDFYKLY